MVRASALVLALYALFLSFYGPVLDHHFAERLPDHEHLYLGRAAPNHIHPYQVPHTDSQPSEAGNTGRQNLSKGEPGPDGIVFFTSHDGVGQDFAYLTMPSIRLSLDIPPPDDTRHTFGVPSDDANPLDVYLALPKQPPRG